jgi:hypothetical protein
MSKGIMRRNLRPGLRSFKMSWIKLLDVLSSCREVLALHRGENLLYQLGMVVDLAMLVLTLGTVVDLRKLALPAATVGNKYHLYMQDLVITIGRDQLEDRDLLVAIRDSLQLFRIGLDLILVTSLPGINRDKLQTLANHPQLFRIDINSKENRPLTTEMPLMKGVEAGLTKTKSSLVLLGNLQL